MNYDEIKVWDGYNCSFCEHKHPLKPECKEKKFCALEIDRAYEKGKIEGLRPIAKLIDDYACEREKTVLQAISEYIYEQTKEKNK